MGLVQRTKKRWQRGETGLQKAALFIQKHGYGGKASTDTSGVGRKLIEKVATSTSSKQKQAVKDDKKAATKARIQKAKKAGTLGSGKRAQQARTRARNAEILRKRKERQAKNKNK